MKILFSFIILIFFTACSSIQTIEYARIQELHTLPQKATPYVRNINKSVTLLPIQNAYNDFYFKPWDSSDIHASLHKIESPFRTYTIFNSYGPNLKPLKLNWFYHKYANANYKDFATINKHAIILHYASLHNFTTSSPVFKNPTKAGEGFPFDYNQNSGVDGDKPIIVSHYSRDKAWVYVFTSFASGWVHASDIAYVSNQDIKTFKTSKYIHLLQDSYPIIDTDGQFICYSRIGMMLPLVKETKNTYEVLIATKGTNNQAVFKDVFIPKRIATTKVLTFSKQNITKVADAIIHSKYGWGGIYGQRDCSAMIRDFFAPFGVWIPRNSVGQAKVGDIISLKNISNQEKIRVIKKEGIPFQTLLDMKGHVLLYAGIYDNKVIVLQDIWGIRIKDGKKTGRIIIGHTAFTTLNIGNHQKYYNSRDGILNKITSMNIVTK